MKIKWKIILIAFIFLLPMVVFFSGCGETESTREPQYYIVNFYTDSAETYNIPSQTIKEGELVREPTTPTKDKYMFNGWYTDTEFTRLWNFNLDTVKGDMTLYAKWEKRNY